MRLRAGERDIHGRGPWSLQIQLYVASDSPRLELIRGSVAYLYQKQTHHQYSSALWYNFGKYDVNHNRKKVNKPGG